VLKAYAFGFFSAALAVLLVAAIWIGTQPKQEEGLLWGDTVYTSKQEFSGYLKEKGLSYKTWLARNPGAAPWEPEEFAVGAITVRASTRTVQLLLAAIGWMLATAGALVLLRGGRPGMPGFAKGSVALFSAVLAGLLAGGIWFTTQSKQEPGLKWGGTVYTSKQEFKGYLKSKGLSYKLWVARNPGAAPWEPAAVRTSTKAPDATKAREVTKAPQAEKASAGWMGRPLLALIGLMLATGSGLLLLRARRPVLARYATSSEAVLSPGGLRIGKSWAGSSRMSASIERVGDVASAATGRLKVSTPLYGARLIRAAQALGRLLISSARAVIAGARELAWRLGRAMHKRDIGAGKVALGLLAVLGAVMVGLIVVSLLSSL
jgi:hypothetical protein